LEENEMHQTIDKKFCLSPRIINELESHFFYNMKWEDRIRKLTKISNEHMEYFVSFFFNTGGFVNVEKNSD
jgi:hypothetical protein